MGINRTITFPFLTCSVLDSCCIYYNKCHHLLLLLHFSFSRVHNLFHYSFLPYRGFFTRSLLLNNTPLHLSLPAGSSSAASAHPQKATLFSSATTTFWFYSNSTFSLLMISRTSDTSPLSFTHLSNVSKFLLTPHWFGYKLHHTETHQSKEDQLWYLFCFKFHLHRFLLSVDLLSLVLLL